MFVNTYYGSFNLAICRIMLALLSHGYLCPNIVTCPSFPLFMCAKGRSVEMAFLCFEPQPWLIKGLEALSCFHAKA